MYRHLEQDGAGLGGGSSGSGCTERTRLHAKLSFLSFVLLHEDPQPPPHDSLDEEEEESRGIQQQRRLFDMASKYFGRVQGIQVAGQSIDVVEVRDQYSQACPFDHIG